MMKTESIRPLPKRRVIDSKRKQYAAEATWKTSTYSSRLNFYDLPPTAEITLEEFEEWAIHRLKVLAELESCQFRNRNPQETEEYMKPLLQKYLPLSQNYANSPSAIQERKKDHYSHFILRLAFSATEDLRKRYTRLETQLFKLRFNTTDGKDRASFIKTLNLDWEEVSQEEKTKLATQLDAVLKSAYPRLKRDMASSSSSSTNTMSNTGGEDDWFRVPWTSVPDLVELRRCFLKAGKAYVPSREQSSLVLTAFTQRLEAALELTARALPRLDEDDRLSPILAHLSSNFSAPGSQFSGEGDDGLIAGAPIHAGNIDGLSNHFPLCMRNLHMTLRQNAHLKHFGRLQYGLFLKGMGLSLEDSLTFWRASFKNITDDTFNKEYRYNVRHAYGDVGGDANRRGRGYTPYSCQKLLTEPLPGTGQTHGCPYRTYGVDNLVGLLRSVGVGEQSVLAGVRDDVSKMRYHVACNRVFEWSHQGELKKVKEEGTWNGGDLDTITHPNEYFKRSYLLKGFASGGGGAGEKKAKVEVEV